MPLLHFSFATELAVMKPFMLLIFFRSPACPTFMGIGSGLGGRAPISHILLTNVFSLTGSFLTVFNMRLLLL